MTVLLSIMVAVLAAALIATLWIVVGVVRRPIDPVPAPLEPLPPRAWQDDLTDLGLRIDRLTNAVADGIERVARSENRIQKTVTSARRLVKESGLEHAGIEAEAEQLRDTDDEGIQPLPAVPEEVEQARAIRIPGGYLTIGAA